MDLTTEYSIYRDAVNKATCNKIIKLTDKGYEKAKIVTGVGTTSYLGRVSDITWIEEPWVYELIWPYMEDANKISGWKFDIKETGRMQLTRYKKGGYYKFHKDGKSDNLSTFGDGTVRKLSMSLILNNNYDGGQLEFSGINSDGEPVLHTPKNQSSGTIIVFPSFTAHRVKPITRGTRYSLVVWFLGPPFK